MNYEKVVNLPCNSPERAIEMFRDLIYNQAYVLFVVLGDNPQTDTILDLSSKIAGSRSDPGLVIWINDPSVVMTEIRNLVDKKNLLNDLDNVSFFMMSIMDSVVDVIKTDEPKVDLLRIFKSFQLALTD